MDYVCQRLPLVGLCRTKVTWLGFGNGHGERMRKTVEGWRNVDLQGKILSFNSLSTKLTKVANYRRTICRVEASDYLLRRINGVADPDVGRSTQARGALLSALSAIIPSLDWRDFETLIDVIFARSGWHRVSPLGKTQKLHDLTLENPVTSEKATVQVKSSASQQAFDEYIAEVDRIGVFDRAFFVCHSLQGALRTPPDRPEIKVWDRHQLAETATRFSPKPSHRSACRPRCQRSPGLLMTGWFVGSGS